jgi:hypothetical protein
VRTPSTELLLKHRRNPELTSSARIKPVLRWHEMIRAGAEYPDCDGSDPTHELAHPSQRELYAHRQYNQTYESCGHVV